MKYLITLFFSLSLIGCSKEDRRERLSFDQKPEMTISQEVLAAKKGASTLLNENPGPEPDYTFSLIDKNEEILTW